MRRTCYPGFFGALFLVLLRVAIGWHFLYEGVAKFDTTRRGSQPFANDRKTEKPFSAEEYLRHSTGPLAPYFRGLVPDVNGLETLDPVRLKNRWADEVLKLAAHYRFDDKQETEAFAVLKKSQTDADVWFQDKEFQEKRSKYLRTLAEVQAVERDHAALAFQRERAAAKRNALDADRRELTKDLDAIEGAMREAVAKIAKPEQREAAGPYVAPRTTLDWVNLSTMWGLVAMGVCLMLGLFARPAALAGAVFLAQIYLSMPPWPGLPANPMVPGHTLIVNQNLIEMLACLALVFQPTAQWIGLDALLFGWMRRGKVRRALERERAEREHDPVYRVRTASQPGTY